MNMIDRIKIQLLTEMTNLEELFEGLDKKPSANKIKTDEIVIHYVLDGVDKFQVIDYHSILIMLQMRAASLREELVVKKRLE